MNRATDTRLRKLEVAKGPSPARMVWSNTFNPAEWDQRVAVLIASGEVSQSDEFMRDWVDAGRKLDLSSSAKSA